MKRKIRKVAILGSGTMGGGIAAHLANAGIRSYLLDIVPQELTTAESSQGLTLDNPAVRNRITEGNRQKLLKARPAALMKKEDLDLITAGNMEDNLPWLSECDWVVEVVPENLAVKKAVLQQIAPFIKPGAIVSTNTSSISISKIAADMPLEFRQNWLGTHFFNPVRYMKLLELIPGEDTLPEIISFMAEFGERVLGKGIVFAKDTPAFVANRLGNWCGPSITQLMAELGLTIPEVDALTGSAIGRPKTGTFGLYDMVGLDVAVAATKTVYDNVDSSEEKAMYILPQFFQLMVEKGMLGAKTKGGFYKKVGKEKQVLDLDLFEYGPLKPVELASVEAAKKAVSLSKKLETFFEGDDPGASFVWRHIKGLFLYAASKIPEVSDDILNIDRALCWGYNHSQGPFELWSGLNLPKYIARMEAEGDVIPAWVKEMLAGGINSFYKTENGIDYYYSIPDKKYLPIKHKPELIILKELKAQNKIIDSNEAGTIYDIGDGIICLQMHRRTSAISEETIKLMLAAQQELAKNWEGMVVAGSGPNFCVGADIGDILGAAADKKWDLIDKALLRTQTAYDANKYSEKPVVMAVHGRALGGGCEMVIQSSAIQAAGESYMGLVEVGVGLIPAGGGIKEAVLKTLRRMEGTKAHPVDVIQSYFENIAMAKVSTSAKEAVKLDYMRPTDGVSLNQDYLISDAKKRALSMIEAGYTAPVKKPFPAFGQNALALLKVGTKQMLQAGLISEYDWHIACRIVDVMAGGSVIAGAMITEEYLEALEREVFISLCGQQKTIDRIMHVLKTGKPLRN